MPGLYSMRVTGQQILHMDPKKETLDNRGHNLACIVRDTKRTQLACLERMCTEDEESGLVDTTALKR